MCNTVGDGHTLRLVWAIESITAMRYGHTVWFGGDWSRLMELGTKPAAGEPLKTHPPQWV